MLVRLFSPTLLAPAAVAALLPRVVGRRRVPASPASSTAASGSLMRRAGGHPAGEPSGCGASRGWRSSPATWLLIAHLAAIPYVWAGLGSVDALFESMSGLTTTGATVFTDFTPSAAASSSGGR